MAVSGAGGRLTHPADAAEAAQGCSWGLRGGKTPELHPRANLNPTGPAGTEGMGSALQC